MTAKRDPELAKLESAERARATNAANRRRREQGATVPSSATDEIPEVSARWVDSDREQLWWRCQFCGTRHVEHARNPVNESGRLQESSFPPGRVHTPCGNLVDVVVQDWTGGGSEVRLRGST